MSHTLSERAARAAKIANQPDAYKICEGCESIVAVRVATCPNCHAYRFDHDVNRIRQHAIALGAREQASVAAQDLF